MDETAAEARCTAALIDLGADDGAAADAAAALVARYGEAPRRYHTLAHLEAVLVAVDALVAAGEPVGDPAAVRVAVWYHDAVVTLDGTDDEARSATLAAADLDGLGVPAQRAAHVAALVRATAEHRADDPDGRVLVDADLAVLAGTPTAYAAYAAAVRAEYAAVGDDAFRAGRAAVLRGLLARPRLFATAAMAGDAEDRARANLARELAGLGVDGPGVDGPGVDGPGVDGPGVDGPVVDGPGVDGPVVDRPVVDRPGGSFAEVVRAVVAATRPGEVVSYGDVAAEAGSPGAARAVGTVLRRSRGLPWWRVVTASGRLVPGKEAEHTARLRAEGVAVRDGRVRPRR